MRSHSLAPRTALGLACLMMAAVSCGGGIALDVQVPKTSTRADGTTPAILIAKATRGGQPIDDSFGGFVKFSTDLGQFTPFASGSTASTPDTPAAQNTSVNLNSGVGKVQLYSVRSGTANVTCTYNDSNGSIITKIVQVQFGSPGSPPHSIQYLGANPPAINLEGSGGVTSTSVTFAVTDASGSPVADGVTVNFVLSQAPGGAAIIPTSAVTANGSGVVQTVLSSGKIAGTVVITASTSNFSAQSDPIQISGRGVNYDDFSLGCDSYYIGGFIEFGLQNNCTVFASDVNGMFVPGTEVSLLSEAGGVPRVVAVNPDPQTGYGRGDFVYQTQCPLPVDTDPIGPLSDPRFPAATGEFRSSEQFYNSCYMKNGVVRPQLEPRTVNPRDGWATLVAYTIGEECYDDKNGNGVYDPGEEDLARCDLGEPFVDENDNNIWDGPGVDPHIPEGEPFFDYDSNGTWTPPNGKWDQRWPIWRKVIIIWTGDVSHYDVVDAQSAALGELHPFSAPNQRNATLCSGSCSGFSPCAGTDENGNSCPQVNNPVDEPHCSSDLITFQWADQNGNCAAGSVPGDTMSTLCNGDCLPGEAANLFECGGRFSFRYPWIAPQPGDLDVNGLYTMTVGYSDGDACAEPPTPGFYSAGAKVTRHLSSLNNGVSHVNEVDYALPLFPILPDHGGYQ